MQVVFGCSYVCCTTFSSFCLKCLPSLWDRVFPAPLCMFLFKENVQEILWTTIPHFGCETIDLLHCQSTRHLSWCVREEQRLQKSLFPLERVAYSCDSSASPMGKSDLSNPDENLIIKNVYFASAGLVVSGLKAPQSPAVVRCNQPCGSLGRSALFPGKLMNLMDLGELCASPGVCGHTAHPVHCSASGERQEFLPDPVSHPPMSWSMWFHHPCHHFTFQLGSYRYH